MEDNKLTYYVEINTEDGTEKALKKLMKFNKEAQDAIKGVTEKSSANDKVAGLKKQLDELSKTWDKYNASQRKGDAGSKTIKEFRELEFEAGAFAGRLRQVIKSQDEQSAAATQVYAKLQNLRKEWKMLTEAELNGARGREIISKYNEIMKSSAAAGLSLDSYVKKLQKQSAEQEKSANVIIGLRGEIKNLETQWNRLSLSQQKGVEGKRLKDQIRALRDEYGKYGSSLKQTVINEEKANSNRLRAQQSANSLSGKIRSLTADWNRLTAAQRSGDAGQRVLKQFNDLRTSAGAYAGTLNQAAKNQIKLATSTTATNTGLYRQSRIVSQLTSQIGMYVSVYALQRFATAVRDITAEFELQRVALTAILQDKAAADKIFGQAVESALESPFRIKDIISYVKQLAAYRVETEKLFETTKRLADISAGLGVDMSRLVLAYGQVRAASVLRGQELRQFTEAGIPLVKLLADKFTELRGVMVSTGEVFELISKRAVPFRMIEEIFNDMTDAGGMFYNMQKIQAETLHGVWANLRDAYDKMYYEMGQKNMGLLKGLGNFLRSLADNWETIATTLQSVVAGYLSYIAVSRILTVSTKVLTAEQIKAIATEETLLYVRLRGTMGVKAATAATKLHTIAQSKLAVANGFLAKSFWKLTAAMAANPIAAIVAGIVAIGVAAGIAIIKANSLKTAMDRLGESTNKFVEMNDKVRPAIETYKELSVVALKSEKQMEDMAGAVETLANKYPSATKIMGEYGDEVEITIGKVERLYEAEMKLRKQALKGDLDRLKSERAELEKQYTQLQNNINYRQERGISDKKAAAAIEWLDKIGAKLAELDAKIKETKEALGLKQDGGVDESLAGLKKYVFELESLEKRAGGNKIKLYDAKEDVSAFGSNIELLEDVAKKYDEASKHAKFYSEQVTNPKISESERETYKNDLRIANAEKELARNILDRYKALDLIKKLKAGDEETENVKRLREEINVAKDARAAYEGYLKTMTEVRAKQTLEGQLKFAGLNFDISDAGAYREYLQNIYDNIKGDPNYNAVRKLIEDIFVDLDTNAIERELKIKLNKIANDIEKTQKANDFFEKVLGITGDIELSKAITIKFTGVAAGEVGDKLREQLQETLQTALGDQALDISGLDILQIEELINKIPDTMTDVKDKAKSFFDKFSDYIRETKIEALELDEQLKLLGMDDSALFGTGVTLDVQKITRDLSNSNKELARERKQLEAEVMADKRAKDKKWLNDQLNEIDRIFKLRQENEKTLAQDRLNDLAKTYVEERLFQEGISELLQDVGDKTYTQLERARKMLMSIGETQLLSLSEATIDRIKELGYTIEELMSIDTIDNMFETLGNNILAADVEMLKLLWHMNQLGLSTGDVESKIKEILSGKINNASVESLKKLSEEINTITGSLFNLFESMGMDSGIVRAIEDLVSNLKVLIVDSGVLRDVFDKVSESAKDFGETAEKALDGVSDTASQTGTSVGGIISAFIGAYVAIVNIIRAVQDAKDAALADEADRYLERTNRQLELLKKRLDDLSSYGDVSWFDDDILKSVQNLYGALKSAQSTFVSSLQKSLVIYKQYYDRYLELISKSKLKNKEKVELSDLLIYVDIYNYIKRLSDELEKMGINIGEGFNILDIDAIREQLRELEKVQALLEAAGDEYAKELAIVNLLKGELEYIVEYYDELKGVIKSFVGDISGSLLTTVNDIWKEIRNEGIKSFEDVKDAAKSSIAEILDTMVSQLLWSKYMGDIFDDFGVALTDALALDGSEDAIMNAFDGFWNAMGDGLKGYTEAYNMFLDSAEKRGWGMSEEAEKFAPGSLSELNKQLSDLEEQWNALSQAEREAAIGLELWNQIEAKKKEIDEAQSYYDYVSALDEAVSKYDDLIDKSKHLKSIVESLAEGGEKDYAQSLLDQTNAEIWAGLYAEYLPDMVKFNDELKDMQKQIQWAIDNDYPDLAEWIQKAYDTKVLENWQAAINEIADDIDNDVEKYKYFQAELQKAVAGLIMAKLSGDTTAQADWEEKIKWLLDIIDGLKGSITDNLWDDYATDAQKYEKELEKINQDLLDALDLYPELADEIADAFNTRVLEEWQDAWDDTFGDLDLNLEKLNAIEAALAEVGVPEISEEEARKGRDAALLSGDTEAYNYYQEQLLMHQKINFLLDERAALIEELGSKYQTEEEEYQAEIAQYESDIATFRALLKKAREDGDVEAANRWQKEIEDAEAAMEEFVDNANFDALQEEFKRQFGDISDIGTAEVRKMLDAFRQQVEDSDLPPELKKQILDDIDDIYDDLDKRTQESFNKIGNAIKDISSLLETFGAEQGLVDSISAIGDAVSALGDITYAIAKGDWWSVFSLAVKFVNSLVKAIQNLVSLLDSDPFAGVEAIGVRIANAEKVVQKSVGTGVAPAQKGLITAYQAAIDELNKGIAEEEAKPDGWLARVLGLATDKEAIAEAEKQIEEYEKLMDEVRESMKADFLQTDYTSFSDSLAEILIAPWDSYMEMMDAVNELTNDTINNIVRHALSLHIQAQVKDALDALYERGIGDESLEMFRDDVRKIVQDGQQVAQYYGQFYDDLASSSTAYDTISRITESQANSFLGYYQNYLVIMTDMHNIMKRIWDNMNRQSININLDAYLTALHTIAANTGAIANNTSRIGAMADDIKIMKNSLARSGAY